MRVFALVSVSFSVAIVGAAVACSQGVTASGAGGSTSSVTTAASKSSSAGGSSSVSAVATGSGGAATSCNPFINDCPDGEACDIAVGGDFFCFPGTNDVSLCGMCDEKNGPYCAPGMSCQLTLADGGEGCSRFCCTDADCSGQTSPGHCDLEILGDSHGVGLCTDGNDAGMPSPACGAPDASPAGACYH